METSDIVGAIIGIILIVAYIGTIAYTGIKIDNEKKIRNEQYINLLIENEKLKMKGEING